MLGSIFTNPALLIGLAAIGLPVLIEWLFRRRKRMVELPTLLYLLKKDEQKKIRRQDQLLLILRCIACGLIALTVARPVIHHDSANMSAKRSVLILLDGTASMHQQVGVTSAFGQAQRRAAEMLRELPQGTRATVAVLSQQVEPVALNEEDLIALADRIEALRPGAGAAAIAEGLNWASAQIEENADTAFEVFVFSDFQKYTWTRGANEAREAGQALHKLTAHAGLQLVDLGAEPTFNYTVTHLAPIDPVLSAGRPVEFEVNVASFGEVPADVKPSLTFLVNGEKKALRTVSGPGRMLIPFRFPGPGTFLVSVELEGDTHRLDNVRTYLCHVPEDVRILILDETVERPGVERESYFLERAVAPPIRPGQDKISRFATHVVHPSRARYENFNDYAVVMLTSSEHMDPVLANKLHGYVSAGGAAVVFADPDVNVYEYNTHLFREQKGLLPVRFKGEADGPARKGHLTFQNARHPAVALMSHGAQDPDREIKRALEMLPEDNRNIELLAQLTDGDKPASPAIVASRYGRGNVVVFNSAAGIRWSAFPATTDFAILIQELCRSLVGHPDQGLNLEVGDTFEQPVLVSAQQLLLRGPDGFKARLTPYPVKRGGEEESLRVRFDQTWRVGMYEVDTKAEVLAHRRFAVNLRPAEGDLTRLASEELSDAFDGVDWTWVPPERSLADTVARRYAVTELATAILWGLLALMAVEALLAALFGRRRGARVQS